MEATQQWKGVSVDVCNYSAASQGGRAEWRKSVSKDYMVHDPIYITFSRDKTTVTDNAMLVARDYRKKEMMIIKPFYEGL